jgi:hypothetical protein
MNERTPFWKNTSLKPDEKNRKLVETCRKVFGTPEGKIVFNMLMTDLYLFDRALTEKETMLNEYAKFFIRERLGVSDTVALTDFIAETAGSGGSK